jgi:hypothetical protein
LSAHAWVDSVDRAATLNKWDVKVAAQGVADALREGANTWRENLQAGSAADIALLADWAQMKVRFLERFAISRGATQKVGIVSNLKQQRSEGAVDFFDRVENSLKKISVEQLASQATDGHKAGFIACRDFFHGLMFVAGLETTTRTWVEAQLETDTTLKNVVSLAVKAELASRRSNPAGRQLAGIDYEAEGAAGGAAATPSSATEVKMVAELAAMKKMIQSLSASGGGGRKKEETTRRKTTMPPMSARDRWRHCWRCRQWGLHIRDECKLSDSDIVRLEPKDKDSKPQGPAFDTQFPNC